MSKKNPAPPDRADLQAALDADYPDRRWLSLLELAHHTGVADTQQMQTAARLSRDQLNRLLDRFESLAGSDILARVPFNLPLPGQRGRPPVVYKLGQAGAALLRANGDPNAHPCRLQDKAAIAHAQATLYVRLAALQAKLAVQTERTLAYGDEQTLRPDNIVTFSSGAPAFFETEQAADLTVLRRIVDALNNKVAFFPSQAAKGYSPVVRVLFHLPRGRALDKTVDTWERAAAIVAQKQGGALPFRILALPLFEFLDRPDWKEPPDAQRWETLFDPASTAAFGPGQAVEQKQLAAPRAAKRTSVKSVTGQLPQPLQRRATGDDRLIMLAYWQYVQEQGPGLVYTIDTPQPDPAFFELMQIVHLASHPPDARPWQQATHPYASLYLLRKYLEIHPRLRDALSKAAVRGGGSMKWNNITIMHRMQVVISTFLRYHGLRVSKSLQAYPAVAAWGSDQSQDFGINVRIAPELLMGPEQDGIVPSEGEALLASQALSWVLWALFAYSEDIGIKRPVFW